MILWDGKEWSVSFKIIRKIMENLTESLIDLENGMGEKIISHLIDQATNRYKNLVLKLQENFAPARKLFKNLDLKMQTFCTL